ncbi:hypothetical protein M0D21_10365 [Aquimarina sp. D1M17]|uniref:hypothetical protein n=1 Tax=Aquimarina acroporae TaxID=2937283 RepID=UPI0020C03105|nr:hypothetical protein [Aquimarina acroporae]MCK8521972.1 hypothetical protein [Aquimarina acroporae]
MHENLRFNLKPKKLNEWQPIIATEYIGTFYMIYIKFLEELKQSNNGDYHVNCKFHLQNFRGAITMGIDYEYSDLLKAKKTSVPFDYMLKIPVSPFLKNSENEDDYPTIKMTFSEGLINKEINGHPFKLETEIMYRNLPKCLFNPYNIKESAFLHPLYLFREGENIQHIYYNKNTDQGVQVTGGKYDVNRASNNNNSQNPTHFGTNGSPTCDAKISEIIE